MTIIVNHPSSGGGSGTEVEITAPLPMPVIGTVDIDGTVPVTGTFWQATQPVSGPLTDAELRAAAVPVNVASLPLPSDAATETTLSTLNGKVTECNTAAVSGPTAEGDTPATNPVFVGGVDPDGVLRPIPVISRVTLDEPREIAISVRSRRLEEALETIVQQNEIIIRLLKDIANSSDPTMPAVYYQTQGRPAPVAEDPDADTFDPNSLSQ